jgi:hypothetical protein
LVATAEPAREALQWPAAALISGIRVPWYLCGGEGLADRVGNKRACCSWTGSTAAAAVPPLPSLLPPL